MEEAPDIQPPIDIPTRSEGASKVHPIVAVLEAKKEWFSKIQSNPDSDTPDDATLIENHFPELAHDIFVLPATELDKESLKAIYDAAPVNGNLREAIGVIVATKYVTDGIADLPEDQLLVLRQRMWTQNEDAPFNLNPEQQASIRERATIFIALSKLLLVPRDNTPLDPGISDFLKGAQMMARTV